VLNPSTSTKYWADSLLNLAFCGSKSLPHQDDSTYPPPEQTGQRVLITPRLHWPYQESLTNERSQKHLMFLNSGILARILGGVIKTRRFGLARGVGVVDRLHLLLLGISIVACLGKSN
jgi:hypothetical protein